MARTLIFTLLILFCFKGFSQVLEQEVSLNKPTKNRIYDNLQVDKKASFPGGNQKLLSFYKQNSRIKVSNLKKPENSVYFVLSVDENGDIYDSEITFSYKKKHVKEAKRLIRRMPKWEPAVHKGEKVKVSVLEYISFDE